MVLHVRLRLPYETFTPIVLALFAVGGVWVIVSGDSFGWYVAGFFGLCLLVAVAEPWLPKPDLSCGYRLLMRQDEGAREHVKRKRESIQWEDVNRIWHVTTSAGPWLPDEWLVFEGETGGVRSQQRQSAWTASGMS